VLASALERLPYALVFHTVAASNFRQHTRLQCRTARKYGRRVTNPTTRNSTRDEWRCSIFVEAHRQRRVETRQARAPASIHHLVYLDPVEFRALQQLPCPGDYTSIDRGRFHVKSQSIDTSGVIQSILERLDCARRRVSTPDGGRRDGPLRVKEREPQTCLGTQISHGIARSGRNFEKLARLFGEILGKEFQQPFVDRVTSDISEVV
jgi:hypothetical protein